MSTPEGNVGNTGEEYFGLLCYPVPVLGVFRSNVQLHLPEATIISR